MDKEKLKFLIWDYGFACQDLGYHTGMEEDDPIYIKVCDKAENARGRLVDFIDSASQTSNATDTIKPCSNCGAIKIMNINYCAGCGEEK